MPTRPAPSLNSSKFTQNWVLTFHRIAWEQRTEKDVVTRLTGQSSRIINHKDVVVKGEFLVPSPRWELALGVGLAAPLPRMCGVGSWGLAFLGRGGTGGEGLEALCQRLVGIKEERGQPRHLPLPLSRCRQRTVSDTSASGRGARGEGRLLRRLRPLAAPAAPSDSAYACESSPVG